MEKKRIVTNLQDVKPGDWYQPAGEKPVKIGKIIKLEAGKVLEGFQKAEVGDVVEHPDGKRLLKSEGKVTKTEAKQASRPKTARAKTPKAKQPEIKVIEPEVPEVVEQEETKRPEGKVIQVEASAAAEQVIRGSRPKTAREKAKKAKAKQLEGEKLTPRQRLIKKGWRESTRKTQEQLIEEGWTKPTPARKRKIEEEITSGERKTKSDKRAKRRGGIIGPPRKSGTPKAKELAPGEIKRPRGRPPKASGGVSIVRKPPTKHFYVMCPVCGWWHITRSALKPGRKRDAKVVSNVFEGIGIDGSPKNSPSAITPINRGAGELSVYHSRILRGAGRGSPNAEVLIDDLSDVDSMPQYLVDRILAQLNYVHAVLTLPPGQRLAAARQYHPSTGMAVPAQTYGQAQVGLRTTPVATQAPPPVTPAQAPVTPAQAPAKKTPSRKSKQEEAKETEPQPESTTTAVSVPAELPERIPFWMYYSALNADKLLDIVTSMVAHNAPKYGPPIPPGIDAGDIKNKRVYDLYDRVVSLLLSWAENFEGAAAISKALAECERFSEKERPDLAGLMPLVRKVASLKHLATVGVTESYKESLAEEIAEAEAQLEETQDEHSRKLAGYRELEARTSLDPTEEVLLKSLATEVRTLRAEISRLKEAISSAHERQKEIAHE